MSQYASPTYYIFNDLRASQNNNTKDGFQVVRFSRLEDAISEFNRLPAAWTTALGIHVSTNSEIDLVQKREGEPVLSGDYQRIPTLYNNVDVRNAVRTLVSQLNIRWQSEYRIYGNSPVLIPVVPNLDFVRDRAINGKQLLPQQSGALHTAIQEAYTPDNGWCKGQELYALAKTFGYNNPHVPKLTTLHVQYTDQHGQVHAGDLSPYNYILMKERTQLIAHDRYAIKSLSEFIEHYISEKDPKLYAELFGPQDRLTPLKEGCFPRVKDRNVNFLAGFIQKGDLAALLEPIVSIIETDLSHSQQPADARELLGRILNIPEGSETKLPIALRLRANDALNKLYSVPHLSQGQERGSETSKEL